MNSPYFHRDVGVVAKVLAGVLFTEICKVQGSSVYVM